jgi:diaminohydroxyphosphoribosylaminopyrimidine deaminase / 5-amino-6-(5-phosphoribosylamino)uracil reductase
VKIHEIYMKRCIEIAKNGLSKAMPNPSVGAVIIHNDNIIGEGFTSEFGGNHAEVNAINSVVNKTLLSESTIYVSLEPCSHFGKTPPCCNLIIDSKIPNVVIGTLDTNKKVAGTGIEMLKESGIHVVVGILEQECRESNIRFFTFHEKKRPYVILKWAESQNGCIAPIYKNEKKPVWITNEYSRQLVHKWRSEEQSILVGTQTVVDDNPKLDVRDWTGKNPIRVILDQNNRIPKDSYIFDNKSHTIVISKNEIDFSRNIAKQVCDFLFEKNIQSVIIEGGSQTLQTFIDATIWDEARVFRGTIYFENGIKAPKINQQYESKTTILDDELLIYKNYD